MRGPSRCSPPTSAASRERQAKRVLVGAFTIEANTFAPGETTLDDFRAQVWAVGADVRRDTLGPRSELAAAQWSVLEDAGCELVPGLATWSAPRQPLTLDCLEQS